MTSEVDVFTLEAARLGLTQPFETVTLRPFQLCAMHYGHKVKRFVLSMDKGLGKTLTILSLFESLELPPGFTCLIFTNEKGMGSYTRDIKKLPTAQQDLVCLVKGNKGQREHKWKTSKARYFVLTYGSFLSDSGARDSKHEVGRTTIIPSWVTDGHSVDAVVLDEFHRHIRRHHSKMFELLKATFKDTKYFIPMSGSAVSKGPEDLWAALHLVDRKLWSSYWKYVATWCEIEDSPFGKQIKGPRYDRIPQWRNAMRECVFHVTREMVKDEMPEIFRSPLDIILPPEQKKLHDQLRDELFTELPNGDYIFAPNTLAAHHKLRLALICPKALDESLGYGQGIEDIWDDAEESELKAYAIFTPFKAPLPHLKTYLEGRGAKVWVLKGGTKLEELEATLLAWRTHIQSNTHKNPGILLSTIKFAESWEIPEASYGYMLGYEHDPEDNKQAESRLCRLVSTGPVFIQYVRALGAYDEEHLQRLIEKAQDRSAMLDDWWKHKATT